MSDLENVFKQKLTNHEVKVSERLWLSVADGLERKKRRRVFLLFALSTAAAVILLLLGVLYVVNNHKKPELKTENNQVATLNSTTKEKISKSNQDSKYGKENSKNDTENNNNSIKPLKENTKKTLFKGNSSKEEKPSKTHISNDNKSDNAVANDAKKTGFNTIKDSYRNAESSTTDNKILQKYKYVVKAKAIKDILNKDKKQRSIKNIEGIRSIFNNAKHGVSTSKIATIDRSIVPISNKSGQLNTCTTINTNHFFVGMYFSPDFYSKNLYGENKDFQLLRSHSERSMLSISAGLDVGYTFKNGAFVKTGFRYSQINEQFHHREIEKIQTVITIDTIIENGSMKIIRDTTRKITYGDNIEKPISFKLYDVPLIFGLQYSLADNQKLGMNIGIIFNIVSTSKGYIFNKDQKIIEFNSEFPNQDIFKTNVGISIYSSFTYSYVINKNIDIFVEPKARFHLNSFTKSGYSLGQKYNTFGLAFGTVYHFPKIGG